MLDGKYRISLKTPLGAMKGTITLISNGNNVQGILEMMGSKNNFNGSKIADDKCRFNGNLNTPMGNLNYDAICSVSGSTLELDAKTPAGSIKILGDRL